MNGEEAPEEMKSRREQVVQKFQDFPQQYAFLFFSSSPFPFFLTSSFLRCGPLLQLVIPGADGAPSIAETMIREKTFEMQNLKEYGVNNDHLKGFFSFLFLFSFLFFSFSFCSSLSFLFQLQFSISNPPPPLPSPLRFL